MISWTFLMTGWESSIANGRSSRRAKPRSPQSNRTILNTTPRPTNQPNLRLKRLPRSVRRIRGRIRDKTTNPRRQPAVAIFVRLFTRRATATCYGTCRSKGECLFWPRDAYVINVWKKDTTRGIVPIHQSARSPHATAPTTPSPMGGKFHRRAINPRRSRRHFKMLRRPNSPLTSRILHLPPLPLHPRPSTPPPPPLSPLKCTPPPPPPPPSPFSRRSWRRARRRDWRRSKRGRLRRATTPSAPSSQYALAT